MNDPEHILTMNRHQRAHPVCGQQTHYQRNPVTGKWNNHTTGEPAPLLGEEWDTPVGDLCPNCLVLVLTHGDDPVELDFWQQGDPSRKTPLEIAETALRNTEIDSDPTRASTPPATGQRNTKSTTTRAPQTPTGQNPKPRSNRHKGRHQRRKQSRPSNTHTKSNAN